MKKLFQIPQIGKILLAVEDVITSSATIETTDPDELEPGSGW